MANPSDRDDTDARRSALRHVLWICGALDTGKTSVTRALAGTHGLSGNGDGRALGLALA